MFSRFSVKSLRVAATRCQILRQRCTKFEFGWTPPPTPLTALPRPIAGFMEPILQRGKGRREGTGRKGRERNSEVQMMGEKGYPFFLKFEIHPVTTGYNIVATKTCLCATGLLYGTSSAMFGALCGNEFHGMSQSAVWPTWMS